jgi:hypothetical protein
MEAQLLRILIHSFLKGTTVESMKAIIKIQEINKILFRIWEEGLSKNRILNLIDLKNNSLKEVL